MFFTGLLILTLTILIFFLFRENAEVHGNSDAESIFCRWGFHPSTYHQDEHGDFLECPLCHFKETFDTTTLDI